MSKLTGHPQPDFLAHFPLIDAAGKVVGRETNAVAWMERVSYSGPHTGLDFKPSGRREEKAASIHPTSYRCHSRCRLKGETHSVCMGIKPFASI